MTPMQLMRMKQRQGKSLNLRGTLYTSRDSKSKLKDNKSSKNRF